MRDITRPDDGNKYYMYRGHFITRDRYSGYYEVYTGGRFWKADTQAGIKRIINDNMRGERS